MSQYQNPLPYFCYTPCPDITNKNTAGENADAAVEEKQELLFEKQLIDQRFPQLIVVPTIPTEGIPLNAGNYRIARTGPSELFSALLISLARTLLSLSSRHSFCFESIEIF